MTARGPALAALAAVAFLGLAGGVAAQDGPDSPASDVAASVLDLEATILDIEATIADLDDGTAVTEAADQTTISLEADVFFDFDEDALRPDATEALEEVARDIAASDVRELRIEGHTDAVGSDAYNLDLSERRGRAVEAFLAGRLQDVRMTVEGLGSTRPVAPNTTADGADYPEGRAKNRRVEIVLPTD